MATRRVNRSRRPAPRRKFIWARENIAAIVAAQTTSGFPLLQDFQTSYGAQLLGSTVVRIRGETLYTPDTSGTSNAAYGIIVLPDNTTVKDPLGVDSAFLDWMAYQPVINDAALSGADRVRRHVVDVKSSRKIEELGEGLWLMVSNPLTATAVNFSAILSIGLKLP